ncbi:MAG: helix-turn-helix transcriptional regulator [Lachnospiraceae bacterium]|nr:helix-turn-helix transcriptional regulator [Lachnospiraceae bacterium]MBQ2320370.1 helix-turn-helix transcriptional regulator [Lachnospiraceae bacterium]
MKNPKIAEKLKYYRKLNKLSVQDVQTYLEENNVTAAIKTIYGWESGQTQPSADTLMLLCRLYHIEYILETFGYKKSSEDSEKTNEKLLIENTAESDPSEKYSTHEIELINAYRKNPNLQEAIDKLLDIH